MNKLQIVPEFDFHEMVKIAGNKVLTTSLNVAKFFGKRHDNVLRKIRQVVSECPDDFAALNFEETDFIDKNGDIQPMFNMTKDGYILVVMGFTGKAAMKIKIAYINAFNWMYKSLQAGRRQFEEERNALMLEYMKEKDVASMSGHLLSRWGKVKKPILTAKIKHLEQIGQITIPDLKAECS